MISVAIVGATGAVGREMLAVLEQRDFPVGELKLLASSRSAGQTVGGYTVQTATPEAFAGVDLALFSAGSAISKELAPAARAAGALVVDNSSAFRLDPDCPLVVPEINGDDLDHHNGVVANPNCSTILLAMALAPLPGVRRAVVCSYQAVSGAGHRAIEELRAQEQADRDGEEPVSEVFPTVLAHNVIPWVQGIEEDGFSTEETKVLNETRRILKRPDLDVSATCVRVPVWRAHAEAVHVDLDAPLSPDDARKLYERAPGVKIYSDGFPTPRDVAGSDEVHVGRLRNDRAFQPGLALWCVMDQLRKGAALNAVQIAERALAVSATT
ncbi:MAG: aspartate-semialdehyde dehydrogenase [Planctomycetota bacterium]|jgi:aspartate-semialdehyde dehydrogenase